MMPVKPTPSVLAIAVETQVQSTEPTGATFTFTFGTYNQTAPWTDVRTLSWPDLANLLVRHEPGQKEGTCIVPATFSGIRRHKSDANRIDVAFLDSDSGITLQEISLALSARGTAAVISSTHSHLCTRTRAKRGNWERFRLKFGGYVSAATFLVQEKGYRQRIAHGATVAEETDEFVTFEHQPCPKFRIAIPLLHPWLAAGYGNQRTANAAWKERIEALAAALELNHDQACTDSSRLFYLPRRPIDGPPAESAILEGTPCDIFSLPPAVKNSGGESVQGNVRGQRRSDPRDGRFEFVEANTAEIFNLKTWASRFGTAFQIATALAVRRPEVFAPKPGEAPKRHLRCTNEDEHTQSGADGATFVVNATDSGSNGFVYHCRHGHCDGRDRLFFLRRMLEERWLSITDLTDPNFLASGSHAKPLIRFVAGTLPDVVDKAEEALLQVNLGLYQRGAFLVRPGVVSVSIASGQIISAQRILEVGDHRSARAAEFDGATPSMTVPDADRLTLRQLTCIPRTARGRVLPDTWPASVACSRSVGMPGSRAVGLGSRRRLCAADVLLGPHAAATLRVP